MLRKIKQFDPYIVIILLAFMVMSVLLVHSATLEATIKISAMKSIIVIVIGLIGFFGASFFDYRILLKYWPYLYGIGIALLIAAFAFTDKVKGARGWFDLGGISFQPAELMKIILIVVIAAFLSKKNGEVLTFVKDVLPVGLLVFVPFMIVVLYPDMGNAAIYLVILIGMYWIGNIKYTHVLIGIVVVGGIAFGAYSIYDTFHDQIVASVKGTDFSHWIVRIDSFLYEDVNKDWSYQKDNSMTAIGSGGLTGQGFLQGEMVHEQRIPLAYTDAIFAVVGEEFGFRGSAVLLLMYFVLIYRMILTAIQSSIPSGSYIIIGIVSMFVLQIFQNVGMLIGLMPITGITLPFISYGGTSLLINMVSMGLVMSVRLHQDKLSAYEQGD